MRASDDRLTYRIEEYPMTAPAWEPLGASLAIEGQSEPILKFASNRNMLARRSYATPREGVTAELVYVGNGTAEELAAASVNGRIVLIDGEIDNVFMRKPSSSVVPLVYWRIRFPPT